MQASIPILDHPLPHVALIELNRPTAANRIQPEDLEALTRQLSACEDDPAVHVLVLTARGAYFSAGFDLRALAADTVSGDHARSSDDRAFEQFANRLKASRLIVIAAINGPVIGGSTDLTLACDLRIGMDSAYLLMPAARFGLPLYASALQRYVSRLGFNHAKRLVFMAQKVEAAEMLSVGFLSELTHATELRARSLDIAAEIAAMPPAPLAAMKQTLNASALSQGCAEPQRAALAAAYDGPRIAARIQAAQSARQLGN